MVSFNVTDEEVAIISKIAQRAEKLLKRDYISVSMDITATHANGTKLDLEKLLNFDNFNFTHDIAGIENHLDRKTGKLDNRFMPRCSV
jgi:hypothetical protein